jgi:dTDP-6-deoxy-L-talose 4-dehydrogenase (NAD+)
MKFLVSGASGFLGSHVCALLESQGHQLFPCSHETRAGYLELDLDQLDKFDFPENTERLIHLAWEGLPNYKSSFHITRNLPRQVRFIELALQNGVKDITVAGTCFEYGMQEGCLKEDIPVRPANYYALAKHQLYQAAKMLCNEYGAHLKWGRFFYMFGETQNPKSLYPQFLAAVKKGDSRFPMSGGLQVRDYLPVEEACGKFVQLAVSSTQGIYNICSGEGVDLRTFIENQKLLLEADIELDLGHYPYPDWEPFRFWGSNEKFTAEFGN